MGCVCGPLFLSDWSERLVDTITTQEIRDAVVTNKVGHRSPAHQKNILKYIRGAFKYALEAGHIQGNPTPEMKFRVRPQDKKSFNRSTSCLIKSVTNDIFIKVIYRPI